VLTLSSSGADPQLTFNDSWHFNRGGMFENFGEASINVGGTTVFARRKGNSPPLLILHEFPETHLMWRAIAPRLADIFTVRTCAVMGPAGAGVDARSCTMRHESDGRCTRDGSTDADEAGSSCQSNKVEPSCLFF
jgi:hypothetical protein